MEHNLDGLLVKYLLGEATAAERDTIDAWLSANEANRRYFDHFKLILDTGKALKTESKLDPDASWMEFKQLLEGTKTASPKIRLLVFKRWLNIAAIWLVAMGVGTALYLQFRKAEMLTLTATDHVITDTLSDGSVITLNKRSSLRYPDRFQGDLREVTLTEGEAFFDIAPNKSKPFIIGVNDVKVRVAGTSFNIKKTKSSTQVIVETGVVQVSRKTIEIKLHPNEKVDVPVGTGDFQKQQTTDKLYNYYLTQQFVANKTPLWRIAQILSEAYGVEIKVPDKKLQNMQLSTTLPNGQLDNNISIICETLNVRARKKNGQIIIE